jgi:reactive intermediate/imine deaminase
LLKLRQPEEAGNVVGANSLPLESGLSSRNLGDPKMRTRNVVLSVLSITMFLLSTAILAAQNPIRRINPSKLSKPNGYSHIVVAPPGEVIYLSGQVALDENGKVVGTGDIQAQTKQVFENLKSALTASGASFANLVKINFYLTDVTQIQKVRDVRDQYIQEEPPASTLVEVKALARPELMIEVDGIAVIPVENSSQLK